MRAAPALAGSNAVRLQQALVVCMLNTNNIVGADTLLDATNYFSACYNHSSQ